jgi:hypothetical protein
MQSAPSRPEEVRIQRGKLVDALKNYTQSDWVKACERLGLFVPPEGGKGSHRSAYKSSDCPMADSTCLVSTFVQKMYPEIQRDVFKNVLFYGQASGKYDEDDVWRALKVKGVPKKKKL